MRLAVVIVTWNVRELVFGCLDSLRSEQERLSAALEVYVVDNASSDGTAQAIAASFPDVHLLCPGQNLGFAGGNNYALRHIGFGGGDAAPRDLPEFVLLLNPDTLVQAGALQTLLDGMQPDVGLAGASLTFGDGSFQHGAYGFPGLAQLAVDLLPVPARLYESRINGRYPRRLYAADQPFEVDFPLGAVYLLRREAVLQTGLFDERFRLYCEEIDWAMRIKRAGWRVLCVPRAHFVHFGGQSAKQVRPQAYFELWRSRLLFFHKHYGPARRAAALALVRLGMRRKVRQANPDEAALIDTYRRIISLTRLPVEALLEAH